MECEMCGTQAGTRRYMVDGTIMQLGLCCAKYGQEMTGGRAPVGSKAAVQQGLERRAGRSKSRDIYQQETLDLIPNFGPTIRSARERKGWDHAKLGDKVSARVPELRHIESGQLRPSDDVARKLERELAITLLEKVSGPAAVTGVAKGGGSGLTIGDLLKDAMDKQ